MQQVLFHRVGGLGIATLNQPSRLNALSLEMIDQLYPQLCAWKKDDSIKAVWLESSSEKAFCAGGDVVSLYHSIGATESGGRNHHAEAFFSREYQLDYLLHHFQKPVIGWGQGIVMGGGLGLMAGCSHRVVTPSSRLAMPEITIGLYPDVGASRFLSRLPGDIGLFLGLTGAMINAADAHYVGLADYMLTDDSRGSAKDAIQAISWSDDPRQNDAFVTRTLRRFGLALDHWPKAVVRPQFELINHLCDADELPEVVDRICHYPGENAWLKKAANNLSQGCPQSAWLVWLAQLKAQTMSLAEVFRMEWNMSMQCIYRGDTQEGVRALLIDKDKKPQFRHQSINDVTEQQCLAFFEQPDGVDQHPLAKLGMNA